MTRRAVFLPALPPGLPWPAGDLGWVAASMPLGLIVGRSAKLLSRAISSRCAITVRSKSLTRAINARTNVRNSIFLAPRRLVHPRVGVPGAGGGPRRVRCSPGRCGRAGGAEPRHMGPCDRRSARVADQRDTRPTIVAVDRVAAGIKITRPGAGQTGGEPARSVLNRLDQADCDLSRCPKPWCWDSGTT